jgi:hypothetical protein
MLITTIVVSSNPVHDEVYSIQHYVITFLSDLRQVGGYLQAIRLLPPIKPSIIYHRDNSNTTDVICGAGTAYPSGAPEFIHGF